MGSALNCSLAVGFDFPLMMMVEMIIKMVVILMIIMTKMTKTHTNIMTVE